ncbi:hypothetical protein DFH09DRAFT_1073005 [Mycena vulgaris]|nr:hypothetical protein DFH09DRAFT_1073005 [Mycena vulgaris]
MAPGALAMMTGHRHNPSNPIHADSFLDDNTNYLQRNHHTSNTPAPLFPDAPFTFGFDTGLPNELPFSDGFRHSSCDLDSLFLHEGDSSNWNPNWIGENFSQPGDDYTSLLSSLDGFGAGLEDFLATADPSLALGSIPAPAHSPPLHFWGSDNSSMNSSGSSTVDLTQHEISSSEAETFLGWEWQKSSTVWLDEGVSSEVCHFSPPTKVSERTKVSHVERVTGLPSQFSTPSQATAFLINVTDIHNLDPDSTVDVLLKDQPKCCGVYACESLASEFTNVERRELDPNSRDRLIEAQLRTREIRDSTRTGQVLLFIKSISDWRCGAVDSTTNRVCSGDMIHCRTGHRTLEIPDFIDEELFLRAVTGEKIVEDEDQEDECCKVSSSRQGKKGRNVYPFNQIKEGRPFEAKVIHLPCKVELFVFIPHEDKHPELARKCIVIPDPAHPHRHPVPPPLKCVRKFGLGATVAKVEKANSTKEILGGLTPSLYHLGLVSRDTKTRLINEVKSEPGNQTKQENQTVESYVAEQRVLPDEKRYIYVSEREGRTAIFGTHHGVIKYIHKVRTLDCDTTFKHVVGKTNLYEINGWMPGINAEVTLGRVWIKIHDRRAFQFVWEELLSLVKRLTNQKLGFAALHRSGTLLGFNADMETAPLLGMADALLPTIDIQSVAEEVGGDAISLLKLIVRICYTHIKRGIPDLSHLPRWWEHKEMHEWLLPTVVQCLSDMAPDDWHVIEATTNFGEAQHKANNVQTGIGMGLVKSFIQYEILDTRRAAEIETMLQSGDLHNPRNEVSHRRSKLGLNKKTFEPLRRPLQMPRLTSSRYGRSQMFGPIAICFRVTHDIHVVQFFWACSRLSTAEEPVDRIRCHMVTFFLQKHLTHTDPDDCGTTGGSGPECSTAQVSTLSEHATRPSRKRSGSTSLESDTPPKRLKLGPLKGWGVERDGVNISAVEYAQKHWSEFQDEYPEILPSILPDDL